MTDIITLARKVWGESAILPFAELERFAELLTAPLKAENEELQQKVCDLRHKLETIKAHIQADCL